MEISFGSLFAAMVLASVYVLGTWLNEQSEEKKPWRRRRISIAAGVSVAYVFLDVLPELATQHLTFLKASDRGILFAEQRIYLLALISFVLLYALDHMVLSSREQRKEAIAEGSGDAIYWLHLTGFAAYSAMIGYLLIERAERGTAPLIVYALAMTIHFLIVDHSMREEHGKVYERTGHWILAISVLAGWLIGISTPFSEAVFARLFAVLAGGVVITSLRSELPDERQGKFWPFCIGALVYALLILLA
jgi:hypothetical protein